MIYFDCKFIQSQKINLISLAMVSGCQELYIINSDWKSVQTKQDGDIFANLLKSHPSPGNTSTLFLKLDDWLEPVSHWLQDAHPLRHQDDMWTLTGWYPSISFVGLSQLWGGVNSLPDKMHKFPIDLRQWLNDLGNPRISLGRPRYFNALSQARWNQEFHKYLINNFSHPAWFSSHSEISEWG